MSIDEQTVALPSLYGAPAYARPPTVAQTKERPFDPDELPIEADQTEEEREFAAMLPARAYAPGGVDLAMLRTGSSEPATGRSPRPFRIRDVAGRLRR